MSEEQNIKDTIEVSGSFDGNKSYIVNVNSNVNKIEKGLLLISNVVIYYSELFNLDTDRFIELVRNSVDYTQNKAKKNRKK